MTASSLMGRRGFSLLRVSEWCVVWKNVVVRGVENVRNEYISGKEAVMNVRNVIAVVVLMVGVWLDVTGQAFYELQYTSPYDHKEYWGLMIHYDDNNCEMRVVSRELLSRRQYYVSKYRSVVSGKKSDDDIGVSYYQPTTKNMPYLVWTWRKRDASDISDIPHIAFRIDDPNSWFKADYFRQIMPGQFTDKYVCQFYGRNEQGYKMLMGGVNRLKQQEDRQRANHNNGTSTPPLRTNVASGATLHLIVIAATNDASIGEGCKSDVRIARNDFKHIAQAVGLKYKETVAIGSNFGKPQLLNALNNLRPGSDDVVVFFYFGHGYRFSNQDSSYPMLDLRESTYEDFNQRNIVNLGDVYNAIVQKGGRLHLVIGDCCNSDVSGTYAAADYNTLASCSVGNFDVNRLKNLFLYQRGSLIITSATPGQVSWISVKGGFFFLSFMDGLSNEVSAFSKSKTPSWQSVINSAYDGALRKTKMNPRCRPQNAIYYSTVKSTGR